MWLCAKRSDYTMGDEKTTTFPNACSLEAGRPSDKLMAEAQSDVPHAYILCDGTSLGNLKYGLCLQTAR